MCNIRIQSSSFRLCPSCNRYIKTLKQYVSEAGSVSVFRQKAPNLLNPLDRVILSHWVPLNRHVLCEEAKILETEKNPVYRKYKEAAYVTCLRNPFNLPSVEISPLWHPLINNESLLVCLIRWRFAASPHLMLMLFGSSVRVLWFSIMSLWFDQFFLARIMVPMF